MKVITRIIIIIIIIIIVVKFILAHQSSGAAVPVSPALNNKPKQFTPALTNALCSAH